MKHTPAPPNPSRRERRGGEALFNKKRARELKAMASDLERPGVARFRPATRRARHDGWTALRQRQFIEALADTGSVSEAADEVGMSRRSAYALRRAATGQAFRFAWDLALEHASQVMADNATARAVNGYTVAKVYGGEVVHEEVRFNEQLVMRLLASRDPYRFGRNPDLARSERHREAAAECMDKAMALIDTELVSTVEGQLSLADARAALDERMAQADAEDAAADKRAARLAERTALRASFATLVSPDELDRSFPADPERDGDGFRDEREDWELPPPAPPPPAVEPQPPAVRRGPSVRLL